MTLKTAIRGVGIDMAVGGNPLQRPDVLVNDRELGVDDLAIGSQLAATADVPSENRHYGHGAQRVFAAIQHGVPQRLWHVHAEVDVRVATDEGLDRLPRVGNNREEGRNSERNA